MYELVVWYIPQDPKTNPAGKLFLGLAQKILSRANLQNRWILCANDCLSRPFFGFYLNYKDSCHAFSAKHASTYANMFRLTLHNTIYFRFRSSFMDGHLQYLLLFSLRYDRQHRRFGTGKMVAGRPNTLTLEKEHRGQPHYPRDVDPRK